MSYKIAVVGATGNVGRVILNVLSDSKVFSNSNVVALASKKSVGKKLSYGDTILEAQDLGSYDFYGTDIAIFSAGSSISQQYAKIAANKGCIVIDNTSFFRMEKDIPLVIPEINPEDIANYNKHNIIANPNCSTIQMLLVLKPLHNISKIKRVVVSTYQSVSGAGKSAMDELFLQTKGTFINQNITPKKFTKRIAFNCIPHIDTFMEDGSTKEEWKMSVETKKILDKNIEVTATCVRVPVFVSHSESLNVEFLSDISEEQAYEALENAPGVLVLDRREDAGYATPLDCVHENEVYVSRLRKDNTIKYGLNMWLVSDNLRKGAALNAVQIAELLVRDYI
ncbi:aspartate-semialdehyde dehydrogenase [Ehrlichia ruminantium]|uniref:Aspartate-semialdehyde dehydrogenase n=1 Tax=Ehrlichia ruminantium (strain Welgevonden) TaxID=254945 RepID=A0A0H3M133_EHRRW|nr:aspartate-semialdehyde dehydrogenase [Ehrlichia ruminantium]QLK54677.1 aspartate-semialdehyde dehydrogenase [Ehrlichia ruminantium]QLK55596.1 aspartate-semialdehyde dehydrogenase [Ehrlichia ruminantium]UOD99698.1 aspartate-semialdehyde dehydrogenase [Ehrlichia ruminantium]CAH57714.1 aspartate-semialdehyde dehydrogenase [Ehrlichia ruminantium str. Welgevonden]CAI27445.1 Aspartate-semialdehyde dehydrogenase [Ehrlichia ruminantium str. Welgevonden]